MKKKKQTKLYFIFAYFDRVRSFCGALRQQRDSSRVSQAVAASCGILIRPQGCCEARTRRQTNTHFWVMCGTKDMFAEAARRDRDSLRGSLLKCVWSVCAGLCSCSPLPLLLSPNPSSSPFAPLPLGALNISTIFIQLRRKEQQKFLLCFRFQHSWPGLANVSAAAAHVSLSAASVKRADTKQNVSAGYAAAFLANKLLYSCCQPAI